METKQDRIGVQEPYYYVLRPRGPLHVLESTMSANALRKIMFHRAPQARENELYAAIFCGAGRSVFEGTEGGCLRIHWPG